MAVEQVNADILRILGLEEADEIDMQSYKGFLREKVVSISMGKSGLSRDEEIIVRDEFKRVRGKTDSVRIKKTTINPRAVFSGKTGGGGLVRYRAPASGSLARRVLPKEKFVDDNAAILGKIDSLLNDIWKNLSEEEEQKKKNERDKKARKDKEDKAAKESSLEKVSKGIVKALEQTFKPVIGIFQRIRNAISLLLLGWVANTLIDWISEPKNLTTFNAILDFLSRNAGKLLLLYVALNNPLVKVVRWLGRNLIKFLVRMIADLTKGKGLLNTLRRGRKGGLLGASARVVTNPGVMATAGVLAGGALANEVTGQRKAAEVQAENKARAQAGQGLGLQGVGGVGDMGATSPYGMLQGVGEYDDGGTVRGPSGIDRVPANLTQGEVVMSVPAVKTFGEDFLLSMNKLGGGTNRPSYSGSRMGFAGGGIVVTSKRGPRGGRMHQGTDIGAPKGTPLYAFSSGRIQEIRREGQGDAGYGNSVYWTDSNGYGHLYAHLDAFARGLSAGMEFKKGRLLGTVGSTGRSSGPHLHWEMGKDPNDVGRNGPTLIDPLKAYGFMTPFEGKPSPSEGLEDPKSPTSPNDLKSKEQSGIVFASEEERRMASAYLNYITQPFNARGIDILPTINQITGVPVGQAGQAPENSVLSGSASKPDPQGVGAAAARQIVR